MIKVMQILCAIMLFGIGFIIGHGMKLCECSGEIIDEVIETNKSVEDIIEDYNGIIRNSNNPDTVLLYKQKKELLLYELFDKDNERWNVK